MLPERQQHWLTRPITRRQFMTLGAVAGAGTALGGGWTLNLYRQSFFDALQITHYRLVTNKFPAHYKPLRLAFLTDLHVGCQSVPPEKLDGIVKQVNAQQADIILLGGDYLTYRNSHYIAPEIIAAKLAPLVAPLGVYSVLGNHDWRCDGMGMWRALQKHNITVMENASRLIKRQGGDFWLTGLADFQTRHPDYKMATKSIADFLPRLVLSHDPITCKDYPDDMNMLQLSGHTHGGQVRLPLLGPVVSPTPNTPLDWLYGRVPKTGTPMIVSSGVGTSVLPLKNTPCEMVVVEITPILSS